jgi:PAS domain S-box-containing protein
MKRGMVSVPYFVDRYDASPGVYPAGRGLTEFVVRTNKAQLLTRQQILFYAQQGLLEVNGTLPEAWLGVPLQTQGAAIGALVVQSYEESSAYSDKDKQFLMFVSDQIAHVVERKQAEERQQQLSVELRQQTRLLEAIMIATPDNFLVADLDGRLRFVSETILRFLKMTAEQVVGKTWRELQIPDHLGGMLDEDWAAVKQSRAPVTREFSFPYRREIWRSSLLPRPCGMKTGQLCCWLPPHAMLPSGGKRLGRCIGRKRWKAWGCWRAALPTILTICWWPCWARPRWRRLI